MKNQRLYYISVGLLILLFTYTSISKILEQHRFIFQMRLSPFVLVKNYAPFWGWVIPLIELSIVSGLLVAKFQKTALIGSLCLLLVFEAYIVGMLLSGLDLPCACGGVIKFMSWQVHVIFNALFITINFIALRTFKNKDIVANIA